MAKRRQSTTSPPSFAKLDADEVPKDDLKLYSVPLQGDKNMEKMASEAEGGQVITIVLRALNRFLSSNS